MHSAVILIHNLPNGSSHFDWLIDQPELQSEHRLLTFRCQHRPDSPVQGGFEAIKLPNHRALYLTYEGPITNNRGAVDRIATGRVARLDQTPHSISVLIHWPSQIIHYQATQSPLNTTLWNFRQYTADPPLDG